MPAIHLTTTKTPAQSSCGMVTANHPLGAAAGAEMLAAGGNAVDAAVATLLALTVVEPMMVGIFGGGLAHLRLPDGRHEVIDGLSSAGGGSHDQMYQPISDAPAQYMQARDRQNDLGRSAVAVPGSLQAWSLMHVRHGVLPFADLVQPAIRYARRGFAVTPYLAGAVQEAQNDLRRDPEISKLFLPDDAPIQVGARLVQADYATTLERIAAEGPEALTHGTLGDEVITALAQGPVSAARLSKDDLAQYTPQILQPIHGTYRGFDIYGPPPPASSGVHVTQMLNMVEPFDLSTMGFDSAKRADLLARVIRQAFVDRNRHSGDPNFVDIPVGRLTSKDYAAQCVAHMVQDGLAAHPFSAAKESADTTHITIADADGLIVTATFTINALFGARFMVPGTGIIPNNYMSNFDPHPGRALSVAAGKRVPTSMAPMIVARDGHPVLALGQPGGLRIFPSVFQTLVNYIDHKMPLQRAIEAPRLWTQGQELELEPGYGPLTDALVDMGHEVKAVPHIGGGLNAIEFHSDGTMTGAACWRADGTVFGMGGGLAEAGVRFWPDRAPDTNTADASDT
ncbi:gamma-glutamyltransferase [Thioclava sp. SK-1]|uniref:gamma-glutamyltransferase n=1 Tax=Thioclava sp. SK-1 TaxID=1889770 RepID=UPI000B26D8C8|nr:gamma-glutamyltransferase [Thioclava sp. SK-1]